MATIDELVIKLSAETSQLRSEMKAATDALVKSTDKMSESVSSLAKTTEKDTGFVKKAFATMAGFLGSQVVIGAFNLAKEAATGMFNVFVVDGVKAASEGQVALNNLVLAMDRAGNAARGTADDMDNFASELQNVTTYEDDAILSAAALLENLTRLNAEGLKKTTTSVVDFAAAMGMDLNTAAAVVGKAIEGNVGALARYGIKVEEGRTKTETYNNVLQALARFQGAAAGQTNTLAGAQTRAAIAFSSFTEIIGNGIVKNKAFVAAFNAISEVLNGFGKDSQDSAKTIRTVFAEILVGSIRVSEGIVAAFGELAPVGIALVNMFLGLGGAIVQTGKALDLASSGKFAEAMAALDAPLSNYTIKLTAADESTRKMTEALGKVGDAAQVGLMETRAGAEAMVEPMNNGKASVDSLKESLTAAEQAALSFANAQITASQTIAGTYTDELEWLNTSHENKLISEEQFQARRLEMLAEKQQEENDILNKGLLQQNANEQVARDARTVLANKHLNETNKARDQQKKDEKKATDDKVAMTGEMLGNIAQLSKTGNKELGAIAKGAAIAQATVSTYAGANKAFEQGGFFGFAMAASVIVAGLANIAKISATPLATGITDVPGIGGSDNFPAMLAPGERVVPAETNQDLKSFLGEGGNARGGNTINVNIHMSDVLTDPRELGLRLIEVISEAAQANGIQMLGSKIA